MESELPWFHAAIKALLASDVGFMSACHQRLGNKAPEKIGVGPYATIQFPTTTGLLGGGGYQSLVQVDGWSMPEGFDGLEGPQVAWRIATSAKRVFESARNVSFETMHYSARPVDLMPLPPDTSRGDSSPLARAMCRAVLTVHNR